MTPSAADILAGNARVIASLASEEGGADYAAARLGVVAMLSVLAAQEAATGAAVRVAENGAIRSVLGEAGADDDLTIHALDAENARLRRALIAHHEALEMRGEDDGAVVALYRHMAASRMLILPAM
jgi:hypothetical protein